MPIKDDDERVELSKITKIFKLIAMLKTGCWTTKQICERAGISRSSWFRYLKLLKGVGFCIKPDDFSRYKIITSADDPTEVKFSLEELHIIRTSLLVNGHHPLYDAMLKKLSLMSELDILPDLFHKAHLGVLVEQIAASIRNQQQIMFKQYHSASSNTIRNRLVEPIEFTDNYGTVLVFDTEDLKTKYFKVERIGSIEETRYKFTNTSLHEKHSPDAFGLSGKANTVVILKLKMRAYLLLREEFPMAIPYITQKNGEYIFEGPVASFAGIGRFVMGLSREVEIVGPKEFDEYIINQTMEILNRRNIN